jgi:hypothetical protein
MTEDGLRFRVWSAICDEYLTQDLQEDEVRRFVREEAIAAALREHESSFPALLERAKLTGSSSTGPDRNLTDPWRAPSDWEVDDA